MDEDSEEGRKPVPEQLTNKEEKTNKQNEGETRNHEDEKETCKLSENAPVNKMQGETDAGEESESERFEDALEDCREELGRTSEDGEEHDKLGSVEEEKEEEEVEVVEEEEENLTPEEQEERKAQALEFKDKGNEFFKKSEYPEAREYYTSAIKVCPKYFTKEKSIFYANRAACLLKMDLNKEAVEDCTKALDLNPDYLKARLRRAQCYEREDRLEEALEDYQKVFDADRSSRVAREALMRLPEQIRVKHEKMKEEMIGKLKDLGNAVLRPFGLSTANFQFQQDPNSGGYSVNFQK